MFKLNNSKKVLSDLIIHMKYSKTINGVKETWEEIVNRNKQMHVNKFPLFKKEIDKTYEYVYDKKIVPSMRSLQFGGEPIIKHNMRIYNCCYLPIESIDCFSEIMMLLLCGTGVGFSVQQHHIYKLPKIRKSKNIIKYEIEDTIEGWSDSIKILLKAYLDTDYNKFLPKFDFTKIRPKGTKLITSGGIAPGSKPLRTCLNNIQKILDTKFDGDRLTSLECHDIICHIADAVYAGGIRRAALISLFSYNDLDMLNCKTGEWWINNSHRTRSNNSVVLERDKITKDDYMHIFQKIKASGSGEPGIYFTYDKDLGVNPCCEVSLQPYQFCNLTEINCSNIISQQDFEERVEHSTFLGTLQASYTNFPYLRSIWKQTTEKEALLGVSLTGLASKNILALDFKKAAKVAVLTNKLWANKLGINESHRITTIKPSGTTSLVFGCSNGIHSYFSDYWIRRMRVGKNEPIYNYLLKNASKLIEDCVINPKDVGIISIPQKAPPNAILRNENFVNFLERIKYLYNNWIVPGHVIGKNTHNISATVNVKNDEWDILAEWIWNNNGSFNGLSMIPYDGGIYKQMPYEECTENEYNNMCKELEGINFNDIKNLSDDQNDFKLDYACSSGGCEITKL